VRRIQTSKRSAITIVWWPSQHKPARTTYGIAMTTEIGRIVAVPFQEDSKPRSWQPAQQVLKWLQRELKLANVVVHHRTRFDTERVAGLRWRTVCEFAYAKDLTLANLFKFALEGLNCLVHLSAQTVSHAEEAPRYAAILLPYVDLFSKRMILLLSRLFETESELLDYLSPRMEVVDMKGLSKQFNAELGSTIDSLVGFFSQLQIVLKMQLIYFEEEGFHVEEEKLHGKRKKLNGKLATRKVVTQRFRSLFGWLLQQSELSDGDFLSMFGITSEEIEALRRSGLDTLPRRRLSEIRARFLDETARRIALVPWS
jgi:hypothetical protein